MECVQDHALEILLPLNLHLIADALLLHVRFGPPQDYGLGVCGSHRLRDLKKLEFCILSGEMPRNEVYGHDLFEKDFYLI
jgi:hypothetical protein